MKLSDLTQKQTTQDARTAAPAEAAKPVAAPAPALSRSEKDWETF
jgi:hypothetical protein